MVNRIIYRIKFNKRDENNLTSFAEDYFTGAYLREIICKMVVEKFIQSEDDIISIEKKNTVVIFK